MLQTVAFAGIFSLAVAMPNAPKAIPRGLLKKVFARSRSAREVTIRRLLKEGLLTAEIRNGIRAYRITEKGQLYLRRARAKSISVPRRWDGRWRIVMFDIKEHRRQVRRSLREELQSYGFFRLQDSVWVFPYPCGDFTALLKADLRVGKDILYLVAEEIENEKSLREHFGLLAHER